MERINTQERTIIKDKKVDPRWTNEIVRLYGEGFCACEPYWESDPATAIIPELEDISKDPYLLVLTLPEGDRLTGFLIAISVDQERFAGLPNQDELQEITKNDLYILELAVDIEFRKKGIGSRLAAEAIDEAQRTGKRGVTLRTDLRNIPAISLYQKLGFDLLTENVGMNPFDIYIRKDLTKTDLDKDKSIITDSVQSLLENYPMAEYMFFEDTGEIKGWKVKTDSNEVPFQLNLNSKQWERPASLYNEKLLKRVWVVNRLNEKILRK
jgi:GNAT superfamily N-acetyltransferase